VDGKDALLRVRRSRAEAVGIQGEDFDTAGDYRKYWK
jgi:hypothetical protein